MKKIIFTEEEIFKLIKSQPGISAPQVAIKLDISRISAFRHLRTLVNLQKLKKEGQGKATRYFPHESIYISNNISQNPEINFSPQQVDILKNEILDIIENTYDAGISLEYLESLFNRYCMYIAQDDTIMRGFDAFLAWCTDPKHGFENRVVSKADEYVQILRSIDIRRKRNYLLDGTETVRKNLAGYTRIGFDILYFSEPAILTSGFGRTKPYIELYYGKANSNRFLLESAIQNSVDPIRQYLQNEGVDAYIITPPTTPRVVQFRDVLEDMLNLKIPKILSGKVSTFERVLRAQKEIRGTDPKERIDNASMSLEVTIPKELEFYKHITIFDDSFTTGATPNAVALKLRDAGYTGKITIITICGNFSYDLAITEDEI